MSNAREALQQNIDVSQRELDRRAAEGEDVSGLMVCPITAAILPAIPTIRKPRPRWHSPIPETCDICESKIADTFTDGATRLGPWAIMCPVCEPRIGRGLGTGQGQKYTREGDTFYKVAG